MGLDLRDIGAVALSFLCIAAVETVSASDIAAVQHEVGAAADLNITATETVSASETKANSLTDYRSLSIAGIDTASLSDSVKERLDSLLIARSETLTASDSNAVQIAPFSIAPLTISKTDSAETSDSAIVEIPTFSVAPLEIALLDTLAINDSATLLVESETSPKSIYAIETLSSSDSSGQTLSELIIQTSDAVYLAETQNEMLEYLNIQMSEVLTASGLLRISVGSVPGPLTPRKRTGLLMGVYP